MGRVWAVDAERFIRNTPLSGSMSTGWKTALICAMVGLGLLAYSLHRLLSWMWAVTRVLMMIVGVLGVVSIILVRLLWLG